MSELGRVSAGAGTTTLVETAADQGAIDQHTPAEDRGTLEVSVRAIERIVTHAADGVPGTVRHESVLQRLRRSSYPRADVTVRGARAWIDLDVAAVWPCRAERLADNVRRQVLAEAGELASVQIERLDVTLHVVAPGDLAGAEERRVR